MKRLFSKTILAAIIVSLVPVHHARANDPRLNVGVVVGATLLGGVIGKVIGDYACKSYREKAEGQTKGFAMLTEAADRDFDNMSFSRRRSEVEPGEERSWNEEMTNGYVFGLGLPKNDSHDLISKVKAYRKNLATEKRAQTKKDLIDTCNNHRDRIQIDTERNSALAKYGWPIFGSILGFVYGWLNK